jgi:hypothetical protein
VENFDLELTQNQQLSVEYHRSYRKLHYGSLGIKILSHGLVFAVLAVLTLIFLDRLTHFYSGMAMALLSKNLGTMNLESVPMFMNKIWVVDAAGIFPSPAMLFWVAVVSVVAWLLVVIFKKIPLPIRLGVKVLSALNLVGCIYFWLWSEHFPYVLRDFSILYVSAEIGMWIAIPLMMMFALLPIPIPVWKKTLPVLFTLIYTFVFGFVRYAFFIYILAKFSYLWMALLYFVLGVFFDFAFMIAFYSYFISLVAPALFKKQRIWRWLYSS